MMRGMVAAGAMAFGLACAAATDVVVLVVVKGEERRRIDRDEWVRRRDEDARPGVEGIRRGEPRLAAR